jgi:hypothetical protein
MGYMTKILLSADVDILLFVIKIEVSLGVAPHFYPVRTDFVPYIK